MRNKLFTAVTAGITALVLQLPAQAADVELRFAHFWPAVAGMHKDVYQVWADKVAKDSEGRIKVDVYPSSTLAKPPAQYEAVKNRVADVTATVLGYTANRFPLTQIVELPGIAKDAIHGSCVVQSLYDEGLLDSEYKDTRPLYFFTHGPGLIHSKEKAIKVPSDFAGLRIRRPTTVVSNLLEELGAKPVGMPAPQTYQSLQRGVIDGVAFPWEGAFTFKVNELAETHTELGGLYTLSFVVTMNKSVYEKMPADLQKVIDTNSGKEWATIAGSVFDSFDVKGRAQAVEAGHEIISIDTSTDPLWKPILDKATEKYLSDLVEKGLPAREVYARAIELSASCTK